MAVLGLHCCVGFSLFVESRGCSLGAVRGLLIAGASLVSEAGSVGFGNRGSWVQKLHVRPLEHRLNSCGAQAYFL